MEEGEKSWNENLRTFKNVFLNICILLLFQNGEKPSSLYIFQLFAFIKKTKRKEKEEGWNVSTQTQLNMIGYLSSFLLIFKQRTGTQRSGARLLFFQSSQTWNMFLTNSALEIIALWCVYVVQKLLIRTTFRTAALKWKLWDIFIIIFGSWNVFHT